MLFIIIVGAMVLTIAYTALDYHGKLGYKLVREIRGTRYYQNKKGKRKYRAIREGGLNVFIDMEWVRGEIHIPRPFNIAVPRPKR